MICDIKANINTPYSIQGLKFQEYFHDDHIILSRAQWEKQHFYMREHFPIHKHVPFLSANTFFFHMRTHSFSICEHFPSLILLSLLLSLLF